MENLPRPDSDSARIESLAEHPAYVFLCLTGLPGASPDLGKDVFLWSNAHCQLQLQFQYLLVNLS
jgi:hypothetical protein